MKILRIDENARYREECMLERCAEIALGRGIPVLLLSAREANVLRVAAMVIQSKYPVESKRLMQVAENFYRQNPGERAPAVDVIHNRDVISLPRLREMLSRLLAGSR